MYREQLFRTTILKIYFNVNEINDVVHFLNNYPQLLLFVSVSDSKFESSVLVTTCSIKGVGEILKKLKTLTK